VLSEEREIPAWVDDAIRKAVEPDPFALRGTLRVHLRPAPPEQDFLNKTKPPLIERNPVIFWKAASFVLMLALIVVSVVDKKSFLQAGHTPTLIAAFLYFDLAFMVWVILGPLAVGIAADLGLSHAQKGLIVATPVLAGAILRMIMGVVVDRLSPKKAAIIGQLVVIGALAYAWLVGVHSFNEVLVLGVFLGVAGASFAAALPLASRWYPPEHQGTAMGIAGAGNSGTAFAALFAPGLAMAFGWHNVFGWR
jgi:uncharacterized protein with PQ loop repeat